MDLHPHDVRQGQRCVRQRLRGFGRQPGAGVGLVQPVADLDPAVADAVDDKARADGVTDGLLDLFAPAAPADAT